MENLRSLVPSMGSLVVFEAAGRLSSFTAAAQELHMTQAAVSYAIGRLETDLGCALFLREHRRVRLSEAGARFHADVTIGLSHIQRSAQDLRERRRDPLDLVAEVFDRLAAHDDPALFIRQTRDRAMAEARLRSGSIATSVRPGLARSARVIAPCPAPTWRMGPATSSSNRAMTCAEAGLSPATP